jgi:hypothetical protein
VRTVTPLADVDGFLPQELLVRLQDRPIDQEIPRASVDAGDKGGNAPDLLTETVEKKRQKRQAWDRRETSSRTGSRFGRKQGERTNGEESVVCVCSSKTPEKEANEGNHGRSVLSSLHIRALSRRVGPVSEVEAQQIRHEDNDREMGRVGMTHVDQMQSHARISPSLDALEETREGRKDGEKSGHPILILVAVVINWGW